MGTEYDADLEEQIEGLETENEVLNLEVNRLTEKMDEMEGKIEAKWKATYTDKMRRLNTELMKELGVTKCSTDDIEIVMAMCRKKINEMRWNQPTTGADARAYVVIPLEETYRSPDYNHYMYAYMNNPTAPWERHMEPRKPELQYYKMTVEELIKDRANMMKALQAMSRYLARANPSYNRTSVS